MSKSDMQFDKSSGTSASPWANHHKFGSVTSRIGADPGNGNAGGEVRSEHFLNKKNSSHVTDKGRGI
jgi:hypothetical protein